MFICSLKKKEEEEEEEKKASGLPRLFPPWHICVFMRAIEPSKNGHISILILPLMVNHSFSLLLWVRGTVIAAGQPSGLILYNRPKLF